MEEKQRAIKLESHSRGNNLNFFNILEQEDESFEKSEKNLRKFMETELNDDDDDISFERVHRTGKLRSTGEKPRPLIIKTRNLFYNKLRTFVEQNL